MRLVQLLVAALLLVAAPFAIAFETQTHALITTEAYARSTLSHSGEGSLLSRLLLDRLHPSDPFKPYWMPQQPSRYFSDHVNFFYNPEAIPALSEPSAFERCQMQQFRQLIGDRNVYRGLFLATVEPVGSPPLLNIRNWLVRGAIREDDMGLSPMGLFGVRGSACASLWLRTVLDQPGWLVRPLNHFYDPVYDIGLTTDPLIQGLKSINWALGYEDSFAHHPRPASGSSRNTYSYLDARNAFWQALTFRSAIREGGSDDSWRRSVESEFRMIYWATLFRSLGNVVHLLEDAAQPQHTRNDSHAVINTDEQQAFEGYTNARVLGGGDVGQFVRGFFSSEAIPLSVPQLGTYGMGQPVMFATPLRFFTTRIGLGGGLVGIPSRMGLADYSNRGFFTGGTLPYIEAMDGYPHTYPPRDLTDPQNGYSFQNGPCESAFLVDGRLSAATCLFYTHQVDDALNPGYAGAMDELPQGFTRPNVPIATEGVFKRLDLPDGLPLEVDRISMTLSPTVLDSIGNLTIPRAIGYSAGLLDFFFRGELELSSPPEGLYAVVDQGTPHHVDDGIPMDASGRVFGFKKLRVRVRNVTMTDANGNPTLLDAGSGTFVPQDMHAGVDSSGNPTGRLVAIARYHRNPCYQPDLSGEYVTMPNPTTGVPDPTDRRVPSGCSLEETRSALQEISVSAPVALDVSGNLPGNTSGAINPCINVGNVNTGTHAAGADCESESVLAEFDFSEDPIPINATDLFLQVAYRGPLGLEEDGIAVGTKDLVEPNYLSGWNGTDWFYLYGHWVPPANFPELPLGHPWAPATMDSMTACVEEQAIATLRSGQHLQPGEFFRIALISDGQQVEIAIQDEYLLRSHTQFHGSNFLRRQFYKEDVDFPYEVPVPYAPGAMPWYARGTPMGMVLNTGFYFYGDEDENRSMQSLILSPAIGTGQPGIAASVNAGFDVAADLCKRTTPPEYLPEERSTLQ